MIHTQRLWLLVWCLAAIVPLSCDKLEDSDVTAEMLPGKWSFKYETSEALDYALSYQYVVFGSDGSCALTYDGGQLEGVYRASRAVIRIDAVIDDGNEHTLLWKVLSLSPYKIVAEYTHAFNDGHEATLTVILEKL